MLTGLSSWLAGTVDWSDTVESTAIPGLSVLTSGPIPPNPAELCHSERFKRAADGAAVIAELVRPDVRDRILLSNGKGVDDAALDKLVESLSAKFQVRKVYRAPEKEE